MHRSREISFKTLASGERLNSTLNTTGVNGQDEGLAGKFLGGVLLDTTGGGVVGEQGFEMSH